MSDISQALWNVCDCLADDLSTITACEAFIVAADALAVDGCSDWANSEDYKKAVEMAGD